MFRFFGNALISLVINCRNIVTHHAEDGSGVGSAIIAGESSHALLVDDNVTTGITADESYLAMQP